MAAIQFGCPWCGAVAEIEEAMAGQQTLCPACSRLLIVPHAAVSPRPDSASPPGSVTPPAPPGNETIVPPPPPPFHSPPSIGSVSTGPVSSAAVPPESAPPLPPESGAIASDATVPPPLAAASPPSANSPSTVPDRAYFAPQPAPHEIAVTAQAAAASQEARRNVEPIPATATLAPSVVGGHAPPVAKDSAREEISLKVKSRRKARRNLIMLTCGLAILLVALGMLLRLSGK